MTFVSPKFKIKGSTPLSGEIKISGSKNISLPVLAATLLTDKEIRLRNFPEISDNTNMLQIMQKLGCQIEIEHKIDNSNGKLFSEKILKINNSNINNFRTDSNLASQLRASIVLLGPGLSRFGRFEVVRPGGCAIGLRPINFHLSGLEKMGAKITIEDEYIKASGKLKGAKIIMEKQSLGATQNITMAAVYADGITRIENASCDPEIVAFCNFLQLLGVKIDGIGTTTLEIQGGSNLSSADYKIPADRFEAGTYCCLAAATDSTLTITNAKEGLDGFEHTLQQMGIKITHLDQETFTVCKEGELIRNMDLTTGPHPHFLPTDLQAQFMSILCLGDKSCTVTENVWENRLMHVEQLKKMGADIQMLSGNKVHINPIKKYSAAQVSATDLRASASLVIAALNAEGETTIDNIHHIERGYEKIFEKLKKCRADITKI